jgi:hypothetical protein
MWQRRAPGSADRDTKDARPDVQLVRIRGGLRVRLAAAARGLDAHQPERRRTGPAATSAAPVIRRSSGDGAGRRRGHHQPGAATKPPLPHPPTPSATPGAPQAASSGHRCLGRGNHLNWGGISHACDHLGADRSCSGDGAGRGLRGHPLPAQTHLLGRTSPRAAASVHRNPGVACWCPLHRGGLLVSTALAGVPLARLATLALRCTRASTSSSVLRARNPRGVERS